MSDVRTRRHKPTLTDLKAGDELSNRYRIIRQLGAGGMGAVYEAEQIQLRKQVALKLMHPEKAEREKNAKRFVREARAASAIKHRNVVEILDFGKLENGTTYLVMELLQGIDLSTLLKREGPLGWPRTRRILLQVLRGIKAAHRQKIIHRDIKPANIFLLDPDDEYAAGDDRIKVLDFGIARWELSEDETYELTTELTDTSELLGTVTYMAPELIRKEPASAQSDLYAVGIMAYKMLTGMTPFGGGTALQVLYAHINQTPPSPRLLRPSIPETVEAVILRALHKNPSRRFQGADEMAQALANIDDNGRPTSSGMSDVLRTSTILKQNGSAAVPHPTKSPDVPRKPQDVAAVGIQPQSTPAPAGDGAKSNSANPVVLGVVLGTLCVLGFVALLELWPGQSDDPARDDSSNPQENEEESALVPDGSEISKACPQGMIEITDDDQQLHFCIDRTEYPGIDVVPATEVDLYHAKDACKTRGHALCTRVQWRRACMGSSKWSFPYGSRRDTDRCRLGEPVATHGPTGAAIKCVTPEGVLDLVGNVSEWTADGFVRGGSIRSKDSSNCWTEQRLKPANKRPHVGFRCCMALPVAGEGESG
ncbi:MAG: bifunctional serine/threonine-protein kinase/formylglycine-generating enzyme family protein [Myxococcota bacterium]